MAGAGSAGRGRGDGPNVPFKQAHLQRLIAWPGRYHFRSLRLTAKAGGGYLAVVAATDTEAATPVVCFGAGPTWGEAWEAVNQAIGRGAWKRDQYPGQQWAR